MKIIMKSNLLKSFRLTLVFCVFFSVFYILVLWLFAKVAGPNGGNAEVAVLGEKVVLTWDRISRRIFISGDGLPVPVTGTMQPVRPEVIRQRRTRSI